MRVDDAFLLLADGNYVGFGFQYDQEFQFEIPTSTKTLSMIAVNGVYGAGIAVSSDHIYSTTDRFGWKCIAAQDVGTFVNWFVTDFDDSAWPDATVSLDHGEAPLSDGRKGVQFIWTTKVEEYMSIYCRGYLGNYD